MESLYHYFNPAIVELLAKAKYGSMNKFLEQVKREPSWWHRSKKKPTIKWFDLEELAIALGCHPSEFLEESQITKTDLAEESAILYTANTAAVSIRIQQLITIHAEGSQKRFSEMTGIGESQVSNMVTKKHAPGFNTLSRIINGFPNLNARWLLTGVGSPISSEHEDQNLRALLDSKDEIIRLLRAQLESK